MSGSWPDFLLQQKVWDSLRDAAEFLKREQMIVAVHPDDLTDEMRKLIAATPLTTLRESSLVKRGTAYMIRPGLLADLTGSATATAERSPQDPDFRVVVEGE